jgi:DNA-binding protein HU-beta
MMFSSLHQSCILIDILFQKREAIMTRVEIIEKMAKDAGVSKAAAQKALDSFIDSIKKTLKKGNKVTLIGFGTFSVGKRAARKGRNPQTGEVIKIKASKAPKFKAGKAFKDAI